MKTPIPINICPAIQAGELVEDDGLILFIDSIEPLKDLSVSNIIVLLPS